MNQESNETSNESVSIEDLQKSIAEKDEMLQNMQQQFDAVKGKADQLLDETKKAKAKAREESESAQRAQTEKHKKNGDFEQLLQSSEKERQALSEQLDTFRNTVATEKMRTESLRMASELADGANAELLSEFISKRLRYTDDGLKVLDKNGELTVSTIDDLKNEFETSDKFKSLIRGNKSSGGGAVGDGGSASGIKTTIERTAFEKMNSGQQMEFMKKGGTLKD